MKETKKFPKIQKMAKAIVRKISLHVRSKDTFGNNIKMTRIFVLYIIGANVLQTSILCKSTKYHYCGGGNNTFISIYENICHIYIIEKDCAHQYFS